MPQAASVSDTVAAEIRAHLGRQRKSQAWLAEQLGVDGATVSRLLSGKRPFSVDELAAAATALGVSVSALLATPAELAS